MKKVLKAILIDSGRVLDYPVTGHWFIAPDFFNYIDVKAYKRLSKLKKAEAFSKAGEYISNQKLVVSEEEEYNHFLIYYKILFDELPELNTGEKTINLIAKDLVYNYSKYKFYTDALEIIPLLSKKYKLAVVSDAWPSLENVFIKAGMRNYFKTFIISSQKGVTKPDELMYKIALNELEILPSEALFIDDRIKNCNGALKLGIETIVINRDLKIYFYNKLFNRNYRILRSFYDLKYLI